MKTMMFLLVHAILFGMLYQHAEGTGHFYGGSMSYVMEKQSDGNYLVIIELITGWVLGKGPCGPSCSKADIGRSTESARATIISSDSHYLGTFELEYRKTDKLTSKTEINTRVNSFYNETVIAISETGKWEQEIMHFSVIMESDKKEIDISFEGNFWRHLTLQNNGIDARWHFQTKIVALGRSDTHTTNHSPKSLAKPFYRIKLGKLSEIRIPAVDADGDFIKCELAKLVEGGKISWHPPPNVTVIDNCTVYINATQANGYTDDSWIAVPVSVRDYNRKNIKYGTGIFISGKYSLSTTAVQFVVQILANLTTPVFVDPTFEGNHVFIMYAGTEWRIQIYAQATENTTIADFIAFGIQGENFTTSKAQDDLKRLQVKFSTMSWKPSADDIGRHIACVSAIDNTDVDSEQRCFVLDVQPDAFNHSSTVAVDKPYFIDIPSPIQFVDCKIHATCVVALYVKSGTNLSEIFVTDSFIDKFDVSLVQYITHKGEQVYKADLSFEHSMHGKKNICFKAKDVNGVESEKACITSHIEPPDPCISAPCKNSASCERDKESGGFKCLCLPRTIGKTCSVNINDCPVDACDRHGRCIDGVGTYTCECFDRFSGINCTVDECPEQRDGIMNCPASGCSNNSCNGRGVCYDGGKCSCPYGYSGQNCETPICDISGNVNGIISPSPKDGSTLTCYEHQGKRLSCKLRVYLAAISGSSPAISIETTDELTNIITVDPVRRSTDLPGISSVFSADISIDGRMNSTKPQYVCVKENITMSKACYGISIIPNPETDTSTRAYSEKNATVKFESPTLKDHSRIICSVGASCQVLLYTTIVSKRASCEMKTTLATGGSVSGTISSSQCDEDDKDNDADDTDLTGRANSPCCEDVISSTDGVTVYSAHARGQSCVTEAIVVYNSPGEKQLCFQSGISIYQHLCYTIGVYAHTTEPCFSSPCQNNGQCLHAGHDNFTCICPDKYIGDKCQQGPCQKEDNNCKNEAYCQTDSGVATCICKAGFSGPNCSIVSARVSAVSSSFTDIARPRRISCVLNQKCSFALIVSERSNYAPNVSAGYVDPSLLLEEIEILDRLPIQNSYQANIRLKSTQLGLKVLCIQTKDINGVNKDELCTEVDIVSDVISIYTSKDRPHFVDPSLPTDAEVECVAGGPCHVLYHVTPGTGNENECVTFKVDPISGFVNYFLFSSCDTCKRGDATNGNCTVDVSIVNNIADKNTARRICLSVGLKGSSDDGEKRCFSIHVKDQTTIVKKGCQTLECKNGGFCDGHDINNPVCFCSKGFSGPECKKAKVDSPMTGPQTQSFIGDFTVPSEVKCVINETCNIPFQVISKNGHSPSVSLGYHDPRLNVMTPSFIPLTSSSTVFQGKVVSIPSKAGDFRFCLQATLSSKTEDEVCVKVEVISTAVDKTDKTKPYFLPPTLSTEATVMCEIKKACHFDMHFTSGDMFAGFTGVCPSLTERSPSPVQGVHIFNVKRENSTVCTGDVTYVPPQADGPHQLCLQVSLPGKKGERRCYTVKVVTDMNKEVISPCRGITCHHNGKCMADFRKVLATYSCICTSAGFTGRNCEHGLDKNKTLPGVRNLNGTVSGSQHFEIDSAIPTDVKCEDYSECCINTPYIGMKNNPPLIGFMSSTLSISNQSVLGTGSTDLTRHISQTCVKAPLGGPYKFCQQTTTNGTNKGMNIDEICINITVQHKNSSHNTPPPHFSRSIPDGSTVLCKPNTICHNQIITEQQPGGQCSQVKECGEGVPGVHFFKTTPVDNLCMTDLAIKTENPNTLDLCTSAGSGGQQNHMKVEVKNESSFGPCQKLHCLNGGSCLAIHISDAVCKCQPGYTGKVCETDIDECSSHPCKNGASCLDKLNDYQCNCMPGYTGADCETDINECTSNPCINGATCLNNVNAYLCNCSPGYNGTNCETDIDECISSPCKNGATCVDRVNSYQCQCSPGYIGTNCD
ncbi:protein eyes shut homolog, partial [Ruditapes philippinarum]|uniref:protein eyes shut homolog n=1 Tax=Ruditapes philippinarum TaxID=129788 RepID=UPI00295A9C57